MNGIHDDLLLLDDSFNNSDNDPVNIQQRIHAEERKDRPPEYPNGGGPSIGDIVRKGDEIVKIISTVIPKRK